MVLIFYNTKAAFLKKSLIAEIVLIPLVLALFYFIPDKKFAASIAGSLFVLLGFYVLSCSRHSGVLTPTFLIALVHTFLISVPMLAVRSYYHELPMAEITIWGIPGPLFHKLATAVYLLMIVTNGIEYYLRRKKI